MVTGEFEFVHNVRVPGMLHGRVVRPPALGRHASCAWTRARCATCRASCRVVVRNELRRGRRRETMAGDAGIADRLEGHLDRRGRRCAPQQDASTTGCVRQPSTRYAAGGLDRRRRHAGVARRPSSMPPTCIRTRCTDRSARRAPSPTCRAGEATFWSATQSAYPMRNTTAIVPRPAADRVRRDLHARRRLLRHQRRRHRDLRRGAALAGRRQAGARAALAQGRNGVGELR